MSSSHFFRYLLILGWWGLSKVCNVGTYWMRNLILHPTSAPTQNLSKNKEIYIENMNKKVVFLMTNMSSQPLWLTHFIEILFVLEL